MAIYLKNCTFIHVPKAAGTWIGVVLTKMNLVVEGTSGKHDSPTLDKPGFAFIRNPESWAISHWCHRQRNNWSWNMGRRLDIACKSENFRIWIENIIKNPDVLQLTLEDFIGKYQLQLPGEQNFHLGKVENAKEDLIRLLDMFGEEFNPEVIRNSVPTHVSKKRPNIPKDLIEDFKSSQKGYYDKYNFVRN